MVGKRSTTPKGLRPSSDPSCVFHLSAAELSRFMGEGSNLNLGLKWEETHHVERGKPLALAHVERREPLEPLQPGDRLFLLPEGEKPNNLHSRKGRERRRDRTRGNGANRDCGRGVFLSLSSSVEDSAVGY